MAFQNWMKLPVVIHSNVCYFQITVPLEMCISPTHSHIAIHEQIENNLCGSLLVKGLRFFPRTE